MIVTVGAIDTCPAACARPQVTDVAMIMPVVKNRIGMTSASHGWTAAPGSG